MLSNVFIGSSTESLEIAKALQANLSYYEFATTIWSQGVFTPSTYPLESLVSRLSSFDFGIFVFAPDDIVKIRKQELGAVRDNVTFEMGLFIGSLGKERTFFVMPSAAEPVRLASDLLGLQPATFNPRNPDKRAALGAACEEIRTAMEKLGPKYRLPSSLARIGQRAKTMGDEEVYLYTFCGLQPEKRTGNPRDPMVGLNSMYRLWADPTDPQNLIQATAVLDQEPNRFRIKFVNGPGCYPPNVTIRPCGLYPLINDSHSRCLALDARAMRGRDDPSNRCAESVYLSFRLTDGFATMWNKGIADPMQECVPVDEEWRTIYLDLTTEWFLFNADGNHYYAFDKDKVDFSIISGLEVEFGSKGGPRLGAGWGEVEIARIRLCNQ